MTLFDIAGFAGRNTILKAGLAASRLWDDVIDGQPLSFSTAIRAFKSISDKDIFFTKGHAGSVDRADELD
jgi:hypothetical protein